MAEAAAGPGWAEHEAEQRRAWLRLTYRQRLDWLWEARGFALRAEEARRRRSPGPAPRTGGGGPGRPRPL